MNGAESCGLASLVLACLLILVEEVYPRDLIAADHHSKKQKQDIQ